MDTIFLIGRIIFGAYFIYNGLNHFRNVKMMAGYAASKGVPTPELAVMATGALMLLGGISYLLGLYPVIGALLLLLFLLPVSFKMHNYWAIEEPQQKAMERINFMKNMALAGAVLITLEIAKPWPISLVK